MKLKRFKSYGRFLSGFPGYLKTPISLQTSREELENRIRLRNSSFLEFLSRCVFGNSRSPYLCLLKEAGCTYDDIAAGVHKDGLEEMLLRLKEAGVWITADEFKGRVPIRRGSFSCAVDPDDFENPCIVGGLGVSTGGSSGGSVKTKLDLEFLAARSAYDQVMFDMLNLRGMPMAIWYPALPASTGIGNILRYAKCGNVPARWFEMRRHDMKTVGRESRIATDLIIRMGRLAGSPLPVPEPLYLDSPAPIIEQIVSWLDEFGGCVFQSYVSQAVRIVGELQKLRGDLSGLVLIVGSEPLTGAKRRRIESSGARLYSRYAATEIGTIAMGCGNPEAVDEYHLMSDMTAIVRDRASNDKEPGPLFFTSLNRGMPRALLNVQMGDMAAVFSRKCGCAFEQLGFNTHLSMVRSCQQFTAQGMAVSRTSLEQIIDEVLTVKHGGSSVDYQFIETENNEGETSVKLRISPEVGAIDTESLIDDFLTELGKKGEGEQLMADIWNQTHAVSVVREYPRPTPHGKILPLLKE